MMEGSSPTKAVIVLEFNDPDYDIFFRVVGKIQDALHTGDPPEVIHVAIDRPAYRVLDAIEQNTKEEEMAIRKHGEGEVIPENEQQKTAAKDGGGMTPEAREALRKENVEADGSGDQD